MVGVLGLQDVKLLGRLLFDALVRLKCEGRLFEAALLEAGLGDVPHGVDEEDLFLVLLLHLEVAVLVVAEVGVYRSKKAYFQSAAASGGTA